MRGRLTICGWRGKFLRSSVLLWRAIFVKLFLCRDQVDVLLAIGYFDYQVDFFVAGANTSKKQDAGFDAPGTHNFKGLIVRRLHRLRRLKVHVHVVCRSGLDPESILTLHQL